jgi:hypothetical protein
MPRNPGTGQYSKPIPDAIPNTTIASTPYNTNVDDVVIDLNLPRPIVAGGTGATNADQALINLGAEKALQNVTNFDSHPWLSGSFKSEGSATASPVASHSFAGIAYIHTPGTYMTVEARDMTDSTVPGRLYIRQFLAGSWGPWTIEGGSDKVAKTGDTMSGNLTINTGVGVNAALILNTGLAAQVIGERFDVPIWTMQLGDGSNNFTLYRHNTTTGAVIDNPLRVTQASGTTALLLLDVLPGNEGLAAQIGGSGANPRIQMYGDQGAGIGAKIGFNTGNGGALEFPPGSALRIRNGTTSIGAFGAGLVLGAPTGGDRGTGTLNAQTVYDDNVVLTCAGVQHLKYGTMDAAQWDALTPTGKHPAARKLSEMLGEGFDPRDPKQFVARMLADEALPGMPAAKDWRHNEIPVGEMISRLWMALELLASAFTGAVARLEEIEKKPK